MCLGIQQSKLDRKLELNNKDCMAAWDVTQVDQT